MAEQVNRIVLPKIVEKQPVKREFPMAKMRELEQLEQSLIAEEKKLKEQLVELKQRKKEFLKNEIAFKEKKLKHDNYIQECDMRRQRAEAIVKEEKEHIKQQDEDIIKLQTEVQRLRIQKEGILKEIRESKVNQFLKKIVEASNGEFKQPKDVVMKYKSLHDVIEKLWQQQMEVQGRIQEEKCKFYQFIEDQKEETLCQNLLISEARERAIQKESELEDIEMALNDAIRLETEKRLRYERAKMSIANMVHMIEKHCNKKITTTDPAKQILKIQQYIEDLRFIIAEVKKSEQSEKTDSDLAQAASKLIQEGRRYPDSGSNKSRRRGLDRKTT